MNEEMVKEWFENWNKKGKEMRELGSAFFDSHAHYNMKNFNGYREKLLTLMNESGVQRIVIPAVGYAANAQMLEMYDLPYVFFAFAAHPKYLWKEYREWDEKRWEEFKTLLRQEKCVAVGETGLDYSYAGITEDQINIQKLFFTRFIECANDASLPVILHIRDADAEADAEQAEYKGSAAESAMEILRDTPIENGAVFHCYGGGYEQACRFMEQGVSAFGIGGRIVTYGSKKLEETVRKLPETAILIETDAPYIRVEREKGPNNSLYLMDVASKIAEIRETSINNILEITYQNGMRFFRKAGVK